MTEVSPVINRPKTAIVYTCCHATPDVPNDRFTWLGNLIYDIKPDYVIDLGDGADMKSLNSYDTRYPQAIVSQSYQADVECYNDAQERLRWKFRHQKRKVPYWIGFMGNHSARLLKAIKLDPRLEGDKYGISLSHLQPDYWFNDYHPYENDAPAMKTYDGITYAHYISAGNYGRAISGKHHAHALIEHLSTSVTVGHSHRLHYYVKAQARPHPLHGLVAGCMKGGDESWGGQSNFEWSKGVAIKRYLENGQYDFSWVSLKALEKEYSN